MQLFVNQRVKDYCGGVLIILLGMAVVLIGRSYQIGSLSRMGPGFFPVALGVILLFAGLWIIAGARISVVSEEKSPLSAEWRGWLCIIASIIAFVAVGNYFGLLPATFAIVVISALGERNNTLWGALALATAIMIVCVVVFWWALQIQFPLIRWGE